MTTDPHHAPQPTGGSARSSRPLLFVAVMLALCAMAFMAWRGPYRALVPGGSSDFSLLWQSTRAWVEGKNPYSTVSTLEVWNAHSGTAPGTEAPSERIDALLVYPPTTYAALAPWTLTDWATSHRVWMVVNTVLLIASITLLLGLAGLRPSSASWWFAAAAALMLAPGHTAISVGQVAIPVLFLLTLAQVLRARSSPPGYAGILLGLACCLKPQIGLLFLAYEFGRRRWSTAIVGLITLAIVTAIGMWWLQRSGIDWIPKWKSNIDELANSNNANPSQANPLRYHLINLHYFLHGFIADLATVKYVVYGVCGTLCLTYFFVDRVRPEDRSELVSLSFVAAISMLVVYHRMYDAVVLMLPLAWVAREIAGRRITVQVLVAGACLGVFLLPGASLLTSLIVSGKIPASIAEAGWFTRFVMPQAPIALLVLAGTMAWTRARDPRKVSV